MENYGVVCCVKKEGKKGRHLFGQRKVASFVTTNANQAGTRYSALVVLVYGIVNAPERK